MNPRAERRGMLAVFAVFALFVQALAPHMAMAAGKSYGQMMICTPSGLQAAPAQSPDPGAPTPAGPCQHCVCPVQVSAGLVSPSIEMMRVTYARAEVLEPPSRRDRLPPARAPPRPPGQGPPTSNA